MTREMFCGTERVNIVALYAFGIQTFSYKFGNQIFSSSSPALKGKDKRFLGRVFEMSF